MGCVLQVALSDAAMTKWEIPLDAIARLYATDRTEGVFPYEEETVYLQAIEEVMCSNDLLVETALDDWQPEGTIWAYLEDHVSPGACARAAQILAEGDWNQNGISYGCWRIVC